MRALPYTMTLLLYILVFCISMTFFLVALFDEQHSTVFAGAGFGVLMLLACRCSYTGLFCHLYTNSEPFLAMMRPAPRPDPPGIIDRLFALHPRQEELEMSAVADARASEEELETHANPENSV